MTMAARSSYLLSRADQHNIATYCWKRVAEHLLLAVIHSSDHGQLHLVEFAMLLQIENGELNGPPNVFLDETR